jgi:hypothetical protein
MSGTPPNLRSPVARPNDFAYFGLVTRDGDPCE